MTYRDLQTILSGLDEDQLDKDLAFAVVACGSLDEVVEGEIVNPRDMGDDQNERDATFVDEVNDSILDDGHPYFIAFIG